jgi:hypothetical protein
VRLSELAVIEGPFSLEAVVIVSVCRLRRPWTRAAGWRRLCGGTDPCAVTEAQHAVGTEEQPPPRARRCLFDPLQLLHKLLF